MNGSGFPHKHGVSETGGSVCASCGSQLGSSFAFLGGGAILEESTLGLSLRNPSYGYLSIGLHGAHSAEYNEPSAQVSILADEPLGQFERQFCSVVCLRGFLNAAVDALGRKLASPP